MSSDASEPATESALDALFYHTERVRFIHWHQFSGAKSAVHLVALIAILAFITGLSNLSQEVILLDGPLAAFVPAPESYVRFSGVFFAVLLAGVTFGLNRRKRLAWYVGVVTLPLATVMPLTALQTNDIPLLLLILVTLPLLVYNREQFDRTLDLSPLQIAALSSIGAVLVYGTVGTYALRDQFAAVETWGDAVYYVIVTIATVGYGDITPVTPETKWFSLSVILLGTGAFTAAIGTLLIPAIEKRMAAAVGNMTPSELSFFEDHVLVLGYGDITEPLLDELVETVDVVVVTERTEDATALKERGINVLTDDPTEKATLYDARIETARGVVVATEDDAQDVMAIIAARQTNPDIHVVAAANDHQHIDKLEQVGADTVISPTLIAGQLLGQSVLGTSISILEENAADDETATEEVPDDETTTEEVPDNETATEEAADDETAGAVDHE